MAKAPTNAPLPDNSLAPAKRTRAGTQDFFGIKPVVPTQPESAKDSLASPAVETAPITAPVDTPATNAPLAASLNEAPIVPAPEAPVAATPVAAPVADEAPALDTPPLVAPAPSATEAAPVTAAAPAALSPAQSAPVEDKANEQKGKKELEPETPPVGEGALAALPEYEWFLERKESDERTHAYISKDLYDNLVYVMQMIGDKKGFTLTSYLNNIITQHFDQYGPEIRKRIREKEALLKKKRRF